MSVAIVDSGGANIASVRFALGRLGVEADLTRDAERIRAAERVILPGVGDAADAMQRLREAGLVEVLPRLGQPVLGVCLGMQLLFEGSEEGDTSCLGVFDGTAELLRADDEHPVPHMGWNQMEASVATPLFAGLPEGPWFYFVHSYAVKSSACTVGVTDYGVRFTSVARRDNFYATQFHPERSAEAGVCLLKNFLELDRCC